MNSTARSGWWRIATRTLRNVALGLVFWTVVSLLFVLPLLGRRTGSPRQLLLAALLQWWLWGILSVGIVRVDRAVPLQSQHAARWVFQHLLAGACFGIVYIYALTALRILVGLGTLPQLGWSSILIEISREMFWSLLIYFMIVGASEVQIYQRRYVDARLRAERSERVASEARLHHLRSQLDPHFLFNTLNGISAYVERDPRMARSMIEHLGDLLRLSLKSQGSDLVTLQDELIFVQQYLTLQKMRFGDRLNIHTDIQEGIDHAMIPGLLLQPLIENALRHGIGSLMDGGNIWLSAYASNGYLFLSVADDGVGFDAKRPPAEEAGIGLRLTRERLAVRYGEETSSLDTRHRDTGGTEVHISLPLQLREDHTHARISQ